MKRSTLFILCSAIGLSIGFGAAVHVSQDIKQTIETSAVEPIEKATYKNVDVQVLDGRLHKNEPVRVSLVNNNETLTAEVTVWLFRGNELVESKNVKINSYGHKNIKFDKITKSGMYHLVMSVTAGTKSTNGRYDGIVVE